MYDNDNWYRKKKDKSLQKRYGITLEEYEGLWKKQGGLCYNCNCPTTTKKDLVVNKPRDVVLGLLCGKCASRIKPRDRMRKRRECDPEGVRAKQRKWEKENPEAVKKHKKKTAIKNKSKIQIYKRGWRMSHLEELKEKQKIWYGNNKDKIRDRQLRKAFGISLVQYSQILEIQGGVCALCKGPPQARAFAVDHDHITGKVRGLLCRGCNVGMGNLKDSPELLEKAAAYICFSRETAPLLGPFQLGNEESNRRLVAGMKQLTTSLPKAQDAETIPPDIDKSP